MKAKTIKAVLRKKVDSWIASIEDEAVRDLVKKNTIVTGGAIASLLLKEGVNDYDVYFKNHMTTLAVAKYYVSRFKPKIHKGVAVPIYVQYDDTRIKIVAKSAGIASENGTEAPYEYFEGRSDEAADNYVSGMMDDPGEIVDATGEMQEAVNGQSGDAGDYRPIFLSTNAITLSGKMQIVLRFFGEPDAIHANYDFVHCTNYWKSWDSELVLRQDALEALLARELRYVGSKYPVCSIIRLRKFIRRGWSVNAGQILKILMQVSQLDLTDHAVLEDQLTGVDAAYFIQLVERLKEKNPEKVEAAYLVEIIDRIF
jgi:hypothetical protein